MKSAMSFWLIGALLTAGVGCSEPLVGEWKGDGDGASRENEMTIFEDGTGEAELYYYGGEDGSTLFSLDFDIKWTALDSGRYDLEFECEGNCSDVDFTMDCTMYEEAETMSCDGDKLWADYDFEWRYEGE